MGWVTVIGPAMEQVDYRLKASAGCSLHRDGGDLARGDDAQVDYRLGDGLDDASALMWIGEGLRDVGIEPGTVMNGEADRARARALMSGIHPQTGEILVAPKTAVDPRGKLPASPLVAAIVARAEAGSVDVKQLLEGDAWALARFGRAERGLRREGEPHRVAYRDAARLAEAAGVDLGALYSSDVLGQARTFAGAKVRVGLRGFDVTLDLPKSLSGLWAIAPAGLSAALLETHQQAVLDSVRHLEVWASYTMTGHHGDGQSAEKVSSSGLLGWLMPHQVARPVDGAAPDPHVHTHVVIAHLAHATDGAWRTIGAGGRDVHRMAHAVDAFAKARFRTLTAERFGLTWAVDARTGQWEVVGIPVELREQLSKRSVQVARELEKLGITDPAAATRMQAKVASASSREAKGRPGPGGVLRAEWRRQAMVTVSADRAVTGPDGRIVPARVVAAAVPGWGPDGPDPAWPGSGGPGPVPSLPQLAAAVVGGLTEHRKEFRRAEVLAAVLDRLPGIDTMQSAEDVVDQVLARDDLVAELPEQGQSHLTHHARYTSRAIVAAERVIVEAAAVRYAEGAALVPSGTAAMAAGAFEASVGFELSAEQRATVERLLTGGHGIDALVGVAGSGKTTIMAAVRAGWHAHGLVVVGASTAAVAAVNLQAESGIPSLTLASWLQRIRTGSGLAGVDAMVLDEAAMCDDRQVAELVTAAGAAGTKLVLVGDPMQLTSPGVGGSFTAVHGIVDGLVLRENRRQRDQAERAALARWRTGDHLGALLGWSAAGRVHVADDGPAALAVMLARWDQTRSQTPDPFARIERTLLLAGTNADVARLNAGARAIRAAAGELGAGREYRLVGGGSLELAVGEVVMTRANDYRARRTQGAQMDVLNGYRGIVTAVDERGITVRWRSGEHSRLSARYIAEHGVSHGYALTVAKAQGLSARQAIVYGAGLDPHTLYSAMSRDRDRVDLVLPRTLLEDEATRARLGEPAGQAEALRRAINAYAQVLITRDEPMISVELGQPLPVVPQARRAAAARSVQHTRRNPTLAATEEMRERDNADQATGQPAWRSRPAGTLSDRQLAEQLRRDRAVVDGSVRIKALTEAVRAGRGPEVTRLREQGPLIRVQAAAIRQAQAARQVYIDTADALSRSEDRLRRLRGQLAEIERRRGPAAWRSHGERRDLGTGIAAAESEVAQLQEKVDQMRAHRDTANAAVAKIPQAGWHGILEMERQHASNWDALLRAAQDQDNASLTSAPSERIAEARRRIPVLNAEQQLRAAMDPAERAGEDRDRAEDARQRAATRQTAPRPGQPRHRPAAQQPPAIQPGRGRGR
jgi:conjugative relaxase-like TrwC/TraI family protein